MFRDTSSESRNEPTTWHAPLASTRKRADDASFMFEERSGELSPVYREIARRIAGDAFTRHASTLGDALR
jgi:hypothetical protein